MNTTILDQAIIFATQAHSGAERRGKHFPYIVHPMEAVSIVATLTTDQELLAAAALHDVVEDTEVPLNEIVEHFGQRVASLVAAESDSCGTWRERKQEAISRIANASHDAKIVAMGDKLSNMRAIARDYATMGDELWGRFHAPNGRLDHEWHYRGLADSLFELAGTEAYTEFVHLIDKVFGLRTFDTAEPISLDDYEESGGGFCATSYNHRDGITMAKFYNPGIPADVPRQELLLAYRVSLMGLSTPMAGRLVTDGTRFGAEYRRVTPKESFARYISNRPDSLESIAIRFANMCRQLHSTPCSETEFESAVHYYDGIIDRTPYFNEAERDRMRQFLHSVPQAHTCIHGDLHIGNVIVECDPADLSPDQHLKHQTYWIDLGDFRWGNPLFDLSMYYFVCNCIPEGLAQHLYHLSMEQMKQGWDVFIRHYLGTDDPQRIEGYEDQLRPFVALKMVDLSLRDELTPEMDAWIRKYLLA